MTGYETLRTLAWPFLPVLHGRVWRDLRSLVPGASRSPIELLDVGGRKSPYTIGLGASVTILDLPRESDIQTRLDLGISEAVLQTVQRRRSNIARVVLEDMTRCSLPSAAYTGVVSVEVIEHVEHDDAFVAQVARVLKPGGWFYLTTPNGDYIKNEPPHYNPDHRRHYTRAELVGLLSRHFSRVQVTYGIRTGKYRVRGLRSVSLRHPVKTVGTAMANVVSHLESQGHGLDEQQVRTGHLFGVAWKADAAAVPPQGSVRDAEALDR